MNPVQLMIRRVGAAVSAVGAVLLVSSVASAQSKPDFPPHSEILKGYDKVVSTADGAKSLYTVWIKKKDGQVLAELPSNFASQKYFLALTVASGARFAGLQAGDMYFYWRRFDKRLAMIAPNVDVRSTGDQESKASVTRLFTDRVILDVPIVTIGPSGGPIIDVDNWLIGPGGQNAATFFGSRLRNGRFRFHTIKKAKAFPENIELAFELPNASGQLQTLHYSISVIPKNTSYKPRKADQRIGFFTTSYSDLGKYSDDETRVRYINRWHLEKRDPKLKLSPPKKPITFYIEHTTPVRYRRWVREGILYWNKAFEKIGLVDAIEVEYQDAQTGAHMEKDPEDVRYNFVRWLNNDVGTAIGPSRVNPETGEILDADIILTDGWIRYYRFQFEDLLPKVTMEGFSPETLAWLAEHPDWDPRIRLAPPAKREFLKAQIARQASGPLAGHPAARVDPTLIGDNLYDGLIGRTSQINGLCLAADGFAFDIALMRMHLDMLDSKDDDKPGGKDGKDDDKDEKKKKDEKDDSDESLIDGMPESFVGPLLAHLVAHEVGHTLGLRHNFKGSSVYTLAEINSEQMKNSKKPLGGSVMDYTPVNINLKGGEVQGPYAMIGIGPYDEWAIQYGYTFDKDLKPILDRVAEPQLQYATDEDTSGPDPLARRYDFSKNPLDYAKDQMRLVEHHRKNLLERHVEKGESWARARRGYELTLSVQFRAVGMMANWIGGVHVYRDKKGDKNGRAPLEVVSAKKQRDALQFVVENAFRDEAYGLTPEMLRYLTTDKWLDGDHFFSAFEDATWPVHDRIMGLQASTLTMLMNPTTLRRVYDNEFRVPADQDALTLAELLQTLRSAIWTELENEPNGDYSPRKPMVSSLRRNLQREYVSRLIDLMMPVRNETAVHKVISNLARMQLKEINGQIGKLLKDEKKLDAYSRAHLSQVSEQIDRALEATYIYNTDKIGAAPTVRYLLGQPEETPSER